MGRTVKVIIETKDDISLSKTNNIFRVNFVQEENIGDFSVGRTVKIKTEVENLGDFWAPAIAIKNNEDGTLLPLN